MEDDSEQSRVVELNVGGRYFTTYRSTLCAVPGSMLEAMFSGRNRDCVTIIDGRYFIDVDPDIFNDHVLPLLRAVTWGYELKSFVPSPGTEEGVRMTLEYLGLLPEDLSSVPSLSENLDQVSSDSYRTYTNELIGHSGIVICLTVLNEYIISGSVDKTLKVWNPSTGDCVQTLTGHTKTIWCVTTFNNRVISGSCDNTLKLWDPTTGNCIRTFSGHACSVISVASTDYIISGSFDNTIKIWDPTNGSCIRTLVGHAYWVTSVGVLSNNHIVSGSNDRTIKIWDPLSGNCIQTLTAHSNNVSCLTVLDDDQIVSASWDCTVKRWDSVTGICLNTIHTISSVGSLTTLNNYIISGHNDGAIEIWDLLSGNRVKTLTSHSNGVTCLVTLHNHVFSCCAMKETIRVKKLNNSFI